MSTALFAGHTILIIGLAREGAAAARWLAERGARVVVSDVRPATEMAAAFAPLASLGVDIRLGPQTPDLLQDIDAVVASPGVPHDIPLFIAARERGIPITSETRLFAQHCPCPLLGVTGSSGKTTTSTLTANMLEASGLRTWLGGNIGAPLLGLLPEMTPHDRVVMELSSFQLLYWAGQNPFVRAPNDGERRFSLPWLDQRGLSPHIAAILNLTPNHLDRHPSMAHYAAAKAHILAYQSPQDVVVLSRDDAVTGGWAGESAISIAAGPGQEAVTFPLLGRILTFGLHGRPVEDGAWVEEEMVRVRWQGETSTILPRSAIRLRGEHNLANILAACCLAIAADAHPAAIAETIRSFTGVPHRLEEVRTRAGVLWINDSIATSPERALAALRSFDSPLILLAGGRDKHLPWDDWAAAVQQRVRYVITFGEAGEMIAAVLAQSDPAHSRLQGIHNARDLPQAVELAATLARPGDVVLLSPGGTSFDAYVDFAGRGEHFRRLVADLP